MTSRPTPETVDELDLSGVAGVLAAHGVLVAWLFGSRAEGTARPDSDVDIAVLLPDEASWLAGQAVASDLAVRLGLPVDVVDLRTAPLELKAKVVQTGRVLHSVDEPLRVRFVTETRSLWFDFAPFQRALSRAFLQRVAARGLSDGRP